jgi:hypothetical protein
MNSLSCTYHENACKQEMIKMYESFIALACTLVFGIGINLCSYLYTKRPVLDSETPFESLEQSEEASVPDRVTRYHSDNAVKFPNSDPFTLHEKRVCYDFANTMALLFIMKKHTLLCNTLKTYDRENKTGVFKLENRFIIKYAEFNEICESTISNDLSSRGINHDVKIVTPVWYSYFENKEYASAVTNEADHSTPGSSNRSGTEITLYDAVNKKNICVNTRDLMSIEIQPVLECSMVFHTWYSRVHFNPKNHDYVIGTMMLSLARSIKYCHDMGMVHGDIKPDNLLVTYNHAADADAEQTDQSSDSGNWQAKLRTAGKTRDRRDIPNIYLIDFGMCGREGKREGTGGTRPFCAPETGNIRIEPRTVSRYSRSRAYNSNSDTEGSYRWGLMQRQHDIWSWALILYTVIAYHDVYNTYDEYPSDTFDSTGYINDAQLDYSFEIKTHPFYPIFEKTLRPPSFRVTSIDPIIELLEGILKEM